VLSRFVSMRATNAILDNFGVSLRKRTFGHWGATERKTRLRIQVTSTIRLSDWPEMGNGNDSRQTGPHDRNSKTGVDPIPITDNLRPVCWPWLKRSRVSTDDEPKRGVDRQPRFQIEGSKFPKNPVLRGLPSHVIPFLGSRWRGGRYACDAPDVMDRRSVLHRLSLNLLSFSLLQEKVDSIPIA
jgi:hypothetical protein